MSEWERIFWGFGPLALLGLIGYLFAMHEIKKDRKRAAEARQAGRPLDQP